MDYCSQNPNADLVGVEHGSGFGESFCHCLFSGGVPSSISLSDYEPTADSQSSQAGVGIITKSTLGGTIQCYAPNLPTASPTSSPTSSAPVSITTHSPTTSKAGKNSKSTKSVTDA